MHALHGRWRVMKKNTNSLRPRRQPAFLHSPGIGKWAHLHLERLARAAFARLARAAGVPGVKVFPSASRLMTRLRLRLRRGFRPSLSFRLQTGSLTQRQTRLNHLPNLRPGFRPSRLNHLANLRPGFRPSRLNHLANLRPGVRPAIQS